MSEQHTEWFDGKVQQGVSTPVGGVRVFRGADGDAGDLYYPGTTGWSSLSSPTKSTRCLFVYPGMTSPGWGSLRPGATSNEAVYMSHGMSYVSAALKARGHLAWLLDMRECRGWADFARRVAAEEYDVAYIGFLSLDIFAAACAIRVLKETHPDRPVIVGGLHVSCAEEREYPGDLPRWYLPAEPHPLLKEFMAWKGETGWDKAKWPDADCVIWNEAEIAACLVAERIAEGKSFPKFINAKTIPDLSHAPHADRDLFNLDAEANAPLLPYLPKPFFTITFGRGCPFSCGFSFSGETLIETTRGAKKIADLVDDADESLRYVQHDGTPGRVVAHVQHSTDSRMVSIRAAYLSLPLRVTEEHVVHVTSTDGIVTRIPARDVESGMFVEVPFSPVMDSERINLAVAAGESDISGDHPVEIIGQSFTAGEHRSSAMCPMFADLDSDMLKFLGLWMAEGSVSVSRGQKSSVLQLTLAKTETTLVEFATGIIAGRFGIDPAICDIGPVIQVQARCPALAAAFRGLFGGKQPVRFIPEQIMALPRERFLAFARGWLLGDGSPGRNHEKSARAAAGVTSSPSIALQMFRKLWSCGIPCAIQRQKQPDEIMGRRVNSGDLWTVRFLRSHEAEVFLETVWPGKWVLPSKAKHEWRMAKDRALLPITEVSDEEFSGDVYDVTVLPHHTVVANGIAADQCNVGEQLSSSSVRLIDVDYFMDELEQLRARYGRIGSLMIHDDILLYPKWLEKWNLELRRRFGYTPYWCQMRADFIVKKRDLIKLMAECGMGWVSIGIESFSQRLLDFMSKGTTVEQNVQAMEICRELGVNVFCNWMLGIPTETPEDVKATADWLTKLRPGFHSASIYCDYPGTALWRFITENGLRLPRHYTKSHYPWQWAIKGVDYDLALATRARITSEFPNKPVRPRFWSVKE